MSALANFQSEFVGALLHPASSLQQRLGVGFSVYQNTVMKGLVDVLQANYRTVEQLVGTEWFQDAALIYARSHLPQQPVLALYGDAFAVFLDEFPPAAVLPYLSAVARIDRLWSEAHFAADAAVLHADALANQSVTLPKVCLRLHPATRFAWLPHSACTIWQHHRAPAMPVEALEIADEDEGVLITRPHGAVQVLAISRTEHDFLSQLQAGKSLGDTAVVLLEQYADANIAVSLAKLINAGAFAAEFSVSNQY